VAAGAPLPVPRERMVLHVDGIGATDDSDAHRSRQELLHATVRHTREDEQVRRQVGIVPLRLEVDEARLRRVER
jgi:hypothetical protein